MRKRSGLSVFLIPLLCTVLAIWLVVSCMGGCKDRVDTRKEAASATRFTNSIVYTQDARTGLCFAIVSRFFDSWYQSGVANVPCEKVKNFFTYTEKTRAEREASEHP